MFVRAIAVAVYKCDHPKCHYIACNDDANDVCFFFLSLSLWVLRHRCSGGSRIVTIRPLSFGSPPAVRASALVERFRCVCCRSQEMENLSESATEYVSRMMSLLVLSLVGVLFFFVAIFSSYTT